MGGKLTIEQLFEHSPEAINLTGFPSSYALLGLGSSLGREVSLQQHRKEKWGKKMVIPSFPVEYIEDRLKFFQDIPYSSLKSTLFTRVFPKRKFARRSIEDFLYFCDEVYETIGEIRKEIKDFKYVPEARRVSRRLRNFDKGLEEVLKTLDEVDKAHTFSLDTESGIIIPIDKMPEIEKKYLADKKAGRNFSYDLGRYGIEDIIVKMKKAVLNLAERGENNFKARIIKFAMDEFEFDSENQNLRSLIEQLGLPVRLYAKHKKLLNLNEDGYVDSWRDEIYAHQPVTSETTPTFGGHYDIRNLCPINLLGRYGVSSEFTPIDLKTRCSENKFLLVGLHSGGKSFLLENLVLASIYGQIPLNMFADKIKMPRYERIFYYKNPDNNRNGKGKAEKEVADIAKITKEARKGDLLVFDEFLDSTDVSIASWLGPDLLEPLRKSKATVFVSTHRAHDYKALEKAGWTIMSPGYKIEKGIVTPTHTIERGIPNPQINKKYMRQRVNSILKTGE